MKEEPAVFEEQAQAHTADGLEVEAEAAEAITPTEPTDELSGLRAELDAANSKAAEYLEGWQRERAEFANYKRRIEREQAESYQATVGAVLNRVLPVLDDFDRAMKEREEQPDLTKWSDGLTLIYRKLQAVVEAEGVTRIEAEGQTFDPNLHEAITTEETDGYASGQIIEVVRHGYKLGERVIRPVLVRVAR